MPLISQFYGIAIYLYFEDHAPPHIHARYAGAEAVIAIADGALIAGELPARALRLVREWVELRRAELEHNWMLASAPAPLEKIPPLP